MAWPHHMEHWRRFPTVIFCLASVQLFSPASSLPVDPGISHGLLKSCLSSLVQDTPVHVVKDDVHVVRKRDAAADQARIDHIERLFDDPLIDPLSIDKYIDSDHMYNLSSAEMHFFREPTYEFHRRIFNRFNKWQKKTFNESMIKLQHALEAYADSHGLKCEKELEVPHREGLKIVFKALGHYREEMLDWVKHTFVDKPKTLVREEKIKLEVYADNDTLAIPRAKVRDFWVFERRFANMMRFYEQEMTDRILDHYDQVVLHYMNTGDRFRFPRTLPNLLDHLAENAHLFTLDLRNETTTEYCPVSPPFSLDSDQKKAAKEQGKNLSTDYD